MRNIFLIILLSFLTVEVIAQESIYNIINIDSCESIQFVGEPELYIGDDLFNLINGGAELYHEFGFVEVLSSEISITGGDPIKVEIFDMGSPESAWGIYSLTATSKAKPFDAGAEGRSGEGFSQFVKGNYMVYFYYGQVEETELTYLAGCISDNIGEYAARPHLMTVIEQEKKDAEKLVYFKGNLGLSSVYNFYYKDVFGYQDGAAAIFRDITIFLLDYKDEGLCTEGYNDAKDFFMQSSKYHDQISLRGSFHIKDRKEQQIDCYFENTFLVIFIYEGEMELNSVREAIIEKFEYP